ncbi:MAG: hypothetical protein U9R60_18870 [Bacteroidota bacterium]|nr:hypothetical protein [Bacteroidota bacterium]
MKSLILAVLLTSSFITNAQDADFNFVTTDAIVEDLQKNKTHSEYISNVGLFTLICFDENIRKTISVIDPENENLSIECFDESNIYPDYELIYKSENNNVLELFRDSEIIEKTKSYFDHMYRGESVEVSPDIWAKGEKEAIFQFYHGKFFTVYMVRIKEGSVSIILRAIGVREIPNTSKNK